MVVVQARLLSGADYTDMKLITEALCMKIGDYSKAARWTRVSKQTIGRYCSTIGDNVCQYMPLDIVADLEKAVGFPLIAEYLANLQGFSLYKNPDILYATKDLQALGRMMGDMSKVFAGVSESYADDGIMTVQEIIDHKIIEHLNRLSVDVLSAKAAYEARVEANE